MKQCGIHSVVSSGFATGLASCVLHVAKITANCRVDATVIHYLLEAPLGNWLLRGGSGARRRTLPQLGVEVTRCLLRRNHRCLRPRLLVLRHRLRRRLAQYTATTQNFTVKKNAS